MSFLAILIALIFEQIRPLPLGNPVHGVVKIWLQWALKNFNVGPVSHSRLAWTLAVGVPSLAVAVIYWLLSHEVAWIAALLWSVIIVYATLGFRQFSHNFTVIRHALYDGDESRARALLAAWKDIDVAQLSSGNTTQQLIEYSVLNAHRRVFGVMAWYCLGVLLGVGPCGAVFYRIAGYVARHVQHTRSLSSAGSTSMVLTSTRLWYWIDWIPMRITALGFAFMGSFEDSIDSWRRQASVTPHDTPSLLLAAASGALNVQLGDATSSSPLAVPAQNGHLRAAVGLVWRIIVMWLVVLFLMSASHLLG